MQQDIRKRADIEIVPEAPSDPDEFLRWSSKRPREEGRYELARGVVTRSIVNVTRNHVKICTNVILELGRLLDMDRYDVGSADFATRTPYGVRCPDAFVCEAMMTDGKALSTDRPIFLGEVLSPSSEEINLEEKREEYTAIPSLRTYVVFSQDEARAWVFSMYANGAWPTQPRVVEGREGAIPLVGLGISLSMAAVYRGIPTPA